MNNKEKLVDLKHNLESGNITIEGLQRALSHLLLSTELLDVEKLSKKFDNDLELAAYTLDPSSQVKAALKVLNEVMVYIEENSSD